MSDTARTSSSPPASGSSLRLAAVTVLFWMALVWTGWLLSMLLHEAGHVAAAWATGGSVQRVVWGPLDFSRTDVEPNPRPLTVVWGGPVVGSLLPVVLLCALPRRAARSRLIVAFLAGFGLVLNGAYIGVGAFEAVGDARVMLRYSTPRSLMLLFGVITFTAGLWLWHRASAPSNRPTWQQLATNHWRTATTAAAVVTVLAAINAAYD